MKIKIKDFFDMVESEGGTYKIKTPSGYKLIGNLYKKTNKDCVRITLSNNSDLSGSIDHLVEVDISCENPNLIFENTTYWLSLGNINVGDYVWDENNELVEVLTKEYIGVHNTYDLEVLDGERKYISNGIVSHNCGKTAVVEGLAMKIFEGDCPQNLLDKRIVSLDMTSIVAGTKYRGQFEERMKVIIDELRDAHDVIIFIDEIHTIIGAGNSSGSLDASNIFKPALARGELQCIGATTLDEYREHIEKDGALERRFQKVLVEPTTITDTIKILQKSKENYEKHHKVHFSDEAIKACVYLADRYITDREFPDKAIDIMDEVGARCQILVKTPEIIEQLKEEAKQIKQMKIDVVRSQKFEEAAELRDRERKILKRINEEKEKFESSLSNNRKEVNEDMVYEVVSSMTKIPVSKLSQKESESLLNLEENLSKSVIGQDEAVSKISKAIRRNRVGIKEPNKPIGSFIFLGSTGIGKCICGDTEIIVRNKITGEIKTIKIENIVSDTNKS